MAFQTPKTVEQVLKEIHARKYLMPAIQREFVWSTDQIVRLFDSLLRGYPLGSFLFWDVQPATAQDYVFYDFLTDYHEHVSPYAEKKKVPSGDGIIAVLDGQQRLTSLNIGLYGTHAERKRYARQGGSNSYPVKKLYLNLVDEPPDEELGLKYDLKFLTAAEAKPAEDEPEKWFRVGQVLELDNSGPSIMKELERRRIPGSAGFQRLYDLYRAIRDLQPLNYYLVEDQDPNKVLEIFVRVNSGGEPLSYSDLLLSMATNQWSSEPGAREEVRSLVTELNSRQFNFSKDVVLKTALMIADVDLRFRVVNFTKTNMAKVEDKWEEIRSALILAADLLKQAGFSERTLTAASVLSPVAYYLHKRQASDSYLDSTSDAADRESLIGWVTRSLVKRGIWGSGLDTLLGRIRDVINTNTDAAFPAAAIEVEMSLLGKALTFDETEIDDLLRLKYNGQRTFPVLAILYPGLDLSKTHHEDHIFPKSRFTRKKLAAAGIPSERIGDFLDAYDLLPNLQLLAGTANIEKQVMLPAEWVDTAFSTDEKQKTYLAENDLDGLPLGMNDFLKFYAGRKDRIRQRLVKALGVSAISRAEDAAASALDSVVGNQDRY
ncbi:hypothetical protein A5725_13535 [Mycobacterium kubicae]|nr:hypothetical protein A5725_13535 [Mycobacterium kubicae]